MFSQTIVVLGLFIVGVLLVLNKSSPFSMFVGVCCICLGLCIVGIDD